MLYAHGASHRRGYAWRFVRIGTLSGAATDAAGVCYAQRAGKTDSSLEGASSPRSASRSMVRLAAWMLPSALLCAAAPPSRPNGTKRRHAPLDGSNRAGYMSTARTDTRRYHHHIHGATKPVKIAARVPESCGDGPWFRSSSLAADPSGNGRSAPTLGVSSASAPCQALLRIPLGLVTRCEQERLATASAVQLLRVALRVQCSGLRPGCFHQRCYAQQHRLRCQRARSGWSAFTRRFHPPHRYWGAQEVDLDYVSLSVAELLPRV